MVGYNVQAVAVLLILFTVHEKANGLKCYICDNCADKPGPETKDCAGACYTFGSKRGCDSKDTVDCYKTAVGGDCYKPEKDADKKIAGKLKECLGLEVTGPNCICFTDLCNGPSEGARSTRGAVATNSTNSSSRAANPSSNGINCFKCKDTPDSECDAGRNMKRVECPNTEYCVKFTFVSPVAPLFAQRDCLDSAAGKCWLENIGDKDGCDYKNEPEKWLRFTSCVNANKGRSPEQEVPELVGYGEACVCKGDLCNQAGGINPTKLLILSAFAIFLL